jgi:ribosomal protein L11 methyltransferase
MGRVTAPGGRAILSGILNPQASEVIAAYEAAGFRLDARDEIGDWTTLVVEKLA